MVITWRTAETGPRVEKWGVKEWMEVEESEIQDGDRYSRAMVHMAEMLLAVVMLPGGR